MARARRRKLNIPLIKGVVMLLVGLVTAAASALTGIGAQIAATPSIAFLLGYSPEKSAGTAIAYALAASLAAVVGAVSGGIPFSFVTVVLVALGATAGTLAAQGPAASPRLARAQRLAPVVALFIGVLVLNEGVRGRFGGPAAAPLAILDQWPAASALVLGALTGALSTTFRVSTGVLLVPGLIYLLRFRAPEAIVVSLAVVAVASLLPAIGYSARGLVGRPMGAWMAAGGFMGGFAGGAVLAGLPVGHFLPYVAFGLAAMFLSGWQLSRAS